VCVCVCVCLYISEYVYMPYFSYTAVIKNLSDREWAGVVLLV